MAYFDAGADADIEQMQADDRIDTEYKIYVNSLPIELNENAIRDIFGQYGKITGMFYPRNATWAYITYGTFREAELAIRELDNKKPLYLKVALAKERCMEEQRLNASGAFETPKVVNTTDLPIHNDMKYQSMGRGQTINTFHKHVMPQITVPCRYTDHGSSSLASPIVGIHEIEDPYASTNKLWTRGVITVTSDGKRHVSLGRGYTLYEYPEPYPKIEECISKVYEQRNNGLYEYSKDKLKNGVQSCSVCSTKTIKHCEKCRTYYCSKACQLEDWPQHQAECERIPALVEEVINSMPVLQVNQDVSQTKKIIPNIISKTAKSSDVKLRRPNTINAVQENMSNMNANVNMHKSITDVNMLKSNTDVTYNSMTNGSRDRHSSGQLDNDINTSQTKMVDQPVINATNTKEFSQQHRLRKYNNTNENIDQSRKNGCSSISSSTDQSRHSLNQSDSSRTSLNKEKYDNSNVRDRTFNNDRNRSPKKNCFQNEKGFTCHNGRENTNRQATSSSYNTSGNNLEFYKDTHLSKTKFITVEVVLSLGNGEYWIIKVEDKDARINLMMKLQDVAAISRNVQPIIGDVYGVLYDNFWYRAVVISLNPIKVNFIDFGNDEILKKDDEIKDIGELATAPKFARKIRLTPEIRDKYKNLQEGDNISVRILSIDSEKTIIVEVQEQSESSSSHTTESTSNNTMKELVSQENYNKVSPNKSTKASIAQIPSILDGLINLLKQKAVSELQIEGFIQIFESVQKNVYSATLSPRIYGTEIEMIFNDLQDECSKVQAAANYKPKTEELICGKCGADGWYRGYISPETSSNLSIIKIDEARIQSVDKILPCPEKYLNICALGVMCEINLAIKLEVGNIYEFTAVINEKNCKQDNFEIEIIIKSEVIQAVLKPWKFITNSPIPLLKNGSKICLTSYRNHYYMFARSLDEDQVEYYNNVMQSVTRYAQTAPYLTEPPIPQQVVIAPFEDGNSYRAMVHKIENDKAQIVYIDFGNVDEVYVKDLKVMPQCHSLQQSCAAKIILKDVPRDVPSNQEVDLYIRNLLGKEVPLVCTYEGTSPKDGVRLTMLTGECVNDKINQLLTPGWKKENDNTCYMLSDIKIASLGRVGDTVDAVVLFVREDDRTMYMMSPSDIELITHITSVMPAMLTKYCEKTEYYIPRTKELCLALYDGAWYRAACLNPKESHTTSQILFIDYGNIESVEHKNIRLMPKDFIEPAAIANMCTVVNLAPVDRNGNYSEAVQKILEELVLPNSPVQIKIVECCENGDYKVELPDIRNALIKRGLV